MGEEGKEQRPGGERWLSWAGLAIESPHPLSPGAAIVCEAAGPTDIRTDTGRERERCVESSRFFCVYLPSRSSPLLSGTYSSLVSSLGFLRLSTCACVCGTCVACVACGWGACGIHGPVLTPSLLPESSRGRVSRACDTSFIPPDLNRHLRRSEEAAPGGGGVGTGASFSSSAEPSLQPCHSGAVSGFLFPNSSLGVVLPVDLRLMCPACTCVCLSPLPPTHFLLFSLCFPVFLCLCVSASEL